MYDSESDGDAPPKLKVIDRRLFDSEGNLREGVVTEEASTRVADLPAATTPTHDVSVGGAPEPVAPAATPDAPQAPAESAPVPVEPPKPLKLGDDAVMRFVEEQYIGGLLALGAMPEPQTGEMVEDLELAQVRIEVLALLQERLGDSLPPAAKKGLDDVMYQLRMAYLQKSKVAKL